MEKLSFLLLILFLFFIGTSDAGAHVSLDFPLGGETFNSGDTINVKWHILINHNLINWDLYFSPDGGVNWETVRMDIPPSQLVYRWVVPPPATTQGRIKIYMDNSGQDYEDVSGDFTINVVTSVEQSTGLPASFTLSQNYPNPFNPVTKIRFGLPTTSNVKIEIFNILGERVSTLLNAPRSPGFHVIEFDGKNLASGVYLYRIIAGDFIQVRKMILIR